MMHLSVSSASTRE